MNSKNAERGNNHTYADVFDPRVIPFASPPGALFLFLAPEPGDGFALLQKQDHGQTTNWVEIGTGSAGNGDIEGKKTGITAETVLDEVLVDNFKMCEWWVFASLDSDPADVKFEKVTGIHDGHTGADATTTKKSGHTKIKIVDIDITLTVDLDDAGTDQKFRLKAAAGAATTFRFRRFTMKE